MQFSIVLPTHNRLNTLKLVLTGIQKQDYLMDQFELVVVSDGSTDGTDEYLANLQTPFRLKTIFQHNQGVASVAPWVSWEQTRLQEQYHDMAQGHWAPTPRQFFTANASIARRHLLSAGGFDAAFRRAEDVELAYRLDQHGLHFVFHPGAVVYHYAERSFEAWMAIPYAYGSNDVIF
ncbi:MAG: glycosyltransferase, partial [Anaerolineales bacterium]